MTSDGSGKPASVQEGQMIEYGLSVITGKWKWIIVGLLKVRKIMRYGELKATLKKPTHKILSQQLRELERDGIVLRRSYNEIPPRVEYSLTPKGKAFMPVITALMKWGEKYQDDIATAKKKKKTFW